MKRHISFKNLKRSFRRIAVSFLAVIMMSCQVDPAGLLAIRAMAAEASDPDKTVIDPLGLEKSVREQVLPMGSKEEDIYFPSSITADVLEKKADDTAAPAANANEATPRTTDLNLMPSPFHSSSPA